MTTHPNDQKPDKEARLMVRAAGASVLVAFILIVIKGWVYSQSGAVSLMGSLLDSVMDSLASVVTLIAVSFAVTPADEEHRFGHGKAEAIAGLLQGVVIFMSSILLLVVAGRKFLNPVDITDPDLGIGAIIVSVLLTLLLVGYQRYVIRRTDSIAIQADSLHYTGDILLNMGVIVALILGGYLQWRYADPIFGVLIAFYLIYNVVQIAKTSINMLMDHEMDPEQRLAILSLIEGHPQVKGVHDMKTRISGANSFIQFHLELDSRISLRAAHTISDEVEMSIQHAFPKAEVLIHADPEDVDENIEFKEK